MGIFPVLIILFLSLTVLYGVTTSRLTLIGFLEGHMAITASSYSVQLL